MPIFRIIVSALCLTATLWMVAWSGPSDMIGELEDRKKPIAGEDRTNESGHSPITNSYGMTFVYIPSGEFFMGSPSDEPGRKANEKRHRVVLSQGFYMMTTEVTQKQWMAVMGTNPSALDGCGSDCPVENVSWVEVDLFIRELNRQAKSKGSSAVINNDALNVQNKPKTIETGGTADTAIKLQYALPTEAQWEYACRAGSQGWFHFEGDSWRLADFGWYKNNSGGQTHVVAQKEANAFGLFDMHGNVWEWCRDISGPYPTKPATDPEGPAKGALRIARGGSWYYPALAARCANRLSLPPKMGNYNVGFRLVLIANG